MLMSYFDNQKPLIASLRDKLTEIIVENEMVKTSTEGICLYLISLKYVFRQLVFIFKKFN